MTRIKESDLGNLLSVDQGPCVSIYMPTEARGAETRQNTTRLKNLLGGAEQQLMEAGLRAPEARQLLAPARELQRDRAFWQAQRQGLALFAAPGLDMQLKLPIEVSELVTVSDSFHLKPLLPLLARTGRCYVLALSQDRIRLLKAGRFEVEQVELRDVPSGIEEGLRFDDPESQLQFHTSTGAPGGDRPAQFHGHGVGADDVKPDVLRYFRKVDRALKPHLDEPELPMVVAGLEYLLPIYWEANTYPHLVEDGIGRHPKRTEPEQLAESAQELMAPRLEAARERAVETYGDLLSAGRATNDLQQVVEAAIAGRVGTLFLARETQIWGRFDRESGQIERHDSHQPGDRDLLDLAAVHTWRNDGDIYLLPAEEVPGGKELAATLRY